MLGTGRIPSLDGLRAVSILMVIFSHAFRSCNFPELPESILFWFNGELGVRIFFVISGFIITYLLLKEENARGTFSISSFYLRRILRILPVYFVFLITVYILSQYLNTELSVNDFLAALTFTTGWWNKSTWLLGHTWSLSVEEQFYLLWPLSLFLIRSKRMRYLSVAGAIMLFPIARIVIYLSPWREKIGFIFITQGDTILMGGLMALLFFYEGERINKWFTHYLVTIRILGICCIVGLNVLSGYKMLGWLTVPLSVTIQSAIIVWMMGSFIIKKDFVFKLLNSKVVVFVGVISYSWYLWQQLFLFTCGRFFNEFYFQFPLNIMLSFLVAVLSYFIIEVNMMKMKNRLV